MLCKSCKREITENSLFCNWCGAEQITQKNVKRLPQAKKMPSGAYKMQLMVDGHRHCITAPTMKECRERAMLLIDHPESVNYGFTIQELIERYLEEKSAVLSPATVRGYKSIIKYYVHDLMKLKAGKLNQSVLQAAINEEAKKGRKEKTLRNIRGLVTSVVRYYCKLDITCDLPPKDRVEHKFLEPEDISRFMAEIYGTKHETALLLALNGLRASEILGLTQLDVDYKSNSLRVRSAIVLNDEDEWVRKSSAKNYTSSRDIPILIPRLAELLRSNIPVVSTEPGMYAAVKKACKNIGVENVGTHGLRHSFVSLCAHLQIPLRETQKMVGHSSGTKVTEEIYTHVAKSDKEAHQATIISFFSA